MVSTWNSRKACRFGCILISITVLALYVKHHGNRVELKEQMKQTDALTTRSNRKGKIKKVRILCWVPTRLENMEERAKYVKATWGQRCDVLLFIGSKRDKELPVINVNVSEGRNKLSRKTKAALGYIYENYRDKADWFLKADDDTYVVIDNLKHYLSNFNTSEALYFGFTLRSVDLPPGFNSGGAGYVLSREALRRFYTKCEMDKGPEDVNIGICMYLLGVTNVNTLDEKNRTRFHAYHPVTHLDASNLSLQRHSAYGYKTGAHNISTMPFTFHYIDGRTMRLLDLLLYHIHRVGQEETVINCSLN